MRGLTTIVLLLISNSFMTYAWYGHLRDNPGDKKTGIWVFLTTIVISWCIAFFEYLFMVPANNRFGLKEGYSPFQLKTIQEVISLAVFCAFAIFFLKEPFKWNYAVAFVCILGAVYFMFYPSK